MPEFGLDGRLFTEDDEEDIVPGEIAVSGRMYTT